MPGNRSTPPGTVRYVWSPGGVHSTVPSGNFLGYTSASAPGQLSSWASLCSETGQICPPLDCGEHGVMGNGLTVEQQSRHLADGWRLLRNRLTTYRSVHEHRSA